MENIKKNKKLIILLFSIVALIFLLFNFPHTYPNYPGNEWTEVSKSANLLVKELGKISSKNPEIQAKVCPKGCVFDVYYYIDEDPSCDDAEGNFSIKLNKTNLKYLETLNKFFIANGTRVYHIIFSRNGRIDFSPGYGFEIVYSPNEYPRYFSNPEGYDIDFHIYQLEEDWYFLKSDLPPDF